MADLGSIGFNGEVASHSAVAFVDYGPVLSFAPVTPSKQSAITSIFTNPESMDGAYYGNSKVWSPAGPLTTVSGQTQESGVAVGSIPVFLYDHRTGELLGKTVSDGSGNFSIPALGRTSTFVVATDSPTFNAIIFDQVVPV